MCPSNRVRGQHGLNKEFPKVEIFTSVKETLDEIARTKSIKEKIDNIKNAIQPLQLKSPKKNNLELHLATICYRETAKKAAEILVMKIERGNKTRWEFGCVMASRDQSISEAIKSGYKQEYGITIELILDRTRTEDPQPLPVALYEVSHAKNGIITLAKITDGAPSVIDKIKEIKFLTEDQIQSFDSTKCVKDFKDTLTKAFKAISI